MDALYICSYTVYVFFCALYIKGLGYFTPSGPIFTPWVGSGMHYGWFTSGEVEAQICAGTGLKGIEDRLNVRPGRNPRGDHQHPLPGAPSATPSSLKHSSWQKPHRFQLWADHLTLPLGWKRVFFFPWWDVWKQMTFQQMAFFCELNAWISHLPEVVWIMNNLNGPSFA